MKYAQNSEEEITLNLFKELSLKDCSYVDIGASNGTTVSNTAQLAIGDWTGLCIEPDKTKYAALINFNQKFPKIKSHNGFATPENIINILDSYNVNKQFAFLSLDIDSYEFFILDKLLEQYRPSIICTEINETIPPPIKFTVLYNTDPMWAGGHFYGCSIEKLNEICIKYNYSLVKLEYYNAFLIDNELKHNLKSLTPKDAYAEGYANKIDRKTQLYWNADVECLHTMTPSQGIEFINNLFTKNSGKYTIGL